MAACGRARCTWLIAGGALLAVVSMQRALQQRDYSLKYIQQVGSDSTPALYNVAAMWSALKGRSCCGSSCWRASRRRSRRFRKRLDDVLVGWALVVMFVVSAFFGLVAFGPANPFASGPPVAVGFDGPGPNPLLQNHPLVLFHLPILYLGYVGFTVPFAPAMAALITGRAGEGWLVETPLGAVRGGFRRSASCSAAGGATRCSAGRACGRGPGRERLADAVADGDRLHPLPCSCSSGAACCAYGT